MRKKRRDATQPQTVKKIVKPNQGIAPNEINPGESEIKKNAVVTGAGARKGVERREGGGEGNNSSQGLPSMQTNLPSNTVKYVSKMILMTWLLKLNRLK